MIDFVKSYFEQPVTIPTGDGETKTMKNAWFMLILFILLFWLLYATKLLYKIPNPFKKKRIRRRRYSINRRRKRRPRRYTNRYRIRRK